MSIQDQEIEVKFYVRSLDPIETNLQELGASEIQTRTHEYNLLFDTLDGQRTQHNQIIRLRKDTADRLTYKSPGITVEGIYFRKEIEFTVSDFDAAQAFLEALGYQVSMIYEKFRQVFTLGTVLVTLDEMPFGNFVEIEGPDRDAIQEASQNIGLNWEARIAASYSTLFQVVCQELGIKINTLTFTDFADITILPGHLGVHPAEA